jgi:hypothetical protein
MKLKSLDKRRGPKIVGPLRLMKGVCRLMRLEMPEEKTASSWMYMRKVSQD